MRCRRIQPLLLDFSSGRREAGLARAIAAHLERCGDCRRVLERETQTASLLASMAPIEPRADAWPAVQAALRAAPAQARWRSMNWRPMLWIGGLVATGALVVSLIAPAVETAAVPMEAETLRGLSPRAAAGLAPERASDPLVAVQRNMDRLLDHAADEGS